jgi:hypothetical protein
MSTDLERRNLVVREMPDATYALMTGIYTGHRLKVAMTCEQPIAQSTRIQMVEESDDVGDTAARYREQLLQRRDAPPNKWLAELVNDGSTRIGPSSAAGRLLARARQNAGFAHAVVGLGRSCFCGIGREANLFLNEVLQQLMMMEDE